MGTIPVRPAAYVRDLYADPGDESGLAESCRTMVRLLRRAHVTWMDAEFGAPEIDCKRPYGSSGVYSDIAEILGIPEDDWSDGEFNPLPEAEWRFLRLHVELPASCSRSPWPWASFAPETICPRGPLGQHLETRRRPALGRGGAGGFGDLGVAG